MTPPWRHATVADSLTTILLLKPALRTLGIAKTETAYSEDVISITTRLFTIRKPKAAGEIMSCLPNHNNTVDGKMAHCNSALDRLARV
jgi:hypothetical protein